MIYIPNDILVFHGNIFADALAAPITSFFVHST